MEKLHIEKNSVQETLVIPLYGRKLCTERFPELFRDPSAVKLIEKLDYDFAPLEKKAKNVFYRFGALEVAMRQTDLSLEVKDYLEMHPEAAVVNMGCGLDQTGENCDNGTCRIYNLDLPDVIEARNQLIPPGERTRNLALDLNDLTWMERIDGAKGAVFFAAGVFYYFKREEMKKLLTAMEERYPGGRIVFDAAGKKAVKIMLKTWVKEAGISSIEECFSIDSVDDYLSGWLKKSNVSSKGYMLGYNDLKHPSVPGLFRFLAKLGDGMMKMKIVRIDPGIK